MNLKNTFVRFVFTTYKHYIYFIVHVGRAEGVHRRLGLKRHDCNANAEQKWRLLFKR